MSTAILDRRRRGRLYEELVDAGFRLEGADPAGSMLIHELDYARFPSVHERHVPSFGAIVAPSVSIADWEKPTELRISTRPLGDFSLGVARRFADGMSTWLVRWSDSAVLAVFDRPSGSERDLVILSDSLGASVVQRHPSGVVRLAGDFGVLRWDGIAWHREPPVRSWIDSVHGSDADGDREVLGRLLAFAVHDLGARGIGATLVYRASESSSGSFDRRLLIPPPLSISRSIDLAPLRHVLAQVDGAAVFDEDGTMREIGVRLVPSARAEAEVDGFRGMRHTASRRYSFDDPAATVIVVSEDGPVTVLRAGEMIGHSEAT